MYSVQFNYFLAPTETIVFASVGGHRLFVYECKADGAMQLLQCYDDPDVREINSFSSSFKLINDFN